jgi:hypothetical protein
VSKARKMKDNVATVGTLNNSSGYLRGGIKGKDARIAWVIEITTNYDKLEIIGDIHLELPNEG